MKKLYFLVVALSAFCFSFAQQKPVHFATGNFQPTNNITTNFFTKDSIASSFFANNYFILITFSALPNNAAQAELKTAGISLHHFVGEKTYLASIANTFNFSNAKNYFIASIDALPSNYKIDPSVFINSQIDKNDIALYAISYFKSISKKEVETTLINIGAAVVKDKFNTEGLVFIQPNNTLLNKIAALPFVYFINKQFIKDKLLNYNANGAHAITSLHLPLRNLQGSGVTVGVGDNANINTHIDFTGRTINRVAYGPQYHGTHTSGTVAGGGIVNPYYTGMAPKSKIVSQWFSDILTNTPYYVDDYKMVATNNSYYSVAVGCAGEGAYDVLSNYIDAQMQTHNEVLHVIAAGNDGQLTCTPYPSFFGTVKSGWQSAKNVLTVGNMDISNYQINQSSSRGPLKDGRIKPEIVTNGTNTLSNYIFNSYGGYSGTSMSSPVITGVTALLQERYKQLNGNNYAKAALIKALLCNTAEDLGNAGPDFTFGFGMLNARRAIEAMENNQYSVQTISNAQNQNINITVPAGARRLKVMVYWADVAAAPNAANALVNDLDVTVTGASGTHLPMVLNTNPASVNNNAAEGTDHINNIEQVVINNPIAGTHSINVNGFSIPAGSQSYYVTWQVDMNGVTVEYPFGGEKILPNTTETIRWNGYGNETNTFTLEYSLNGTTWNLIDNNIPATAQSYNWNVPNFFSDNALIRITRNGTSYADISNAYFTIAAQPTLAISNDCPGYAQLNWNAVPSAISYDVMQLIGDSMKVIGNTNSTNFLVGGLNKYQTAWFAVQAKFANTVGRRSIAQFILPNAGACTLATYDNDIIIDSILEPVSKRIGFSGSGGMPTALKVRIKNNGSTAIATPFNVSFTPSNIGTTTEVVSASIAAGASYDYTFTGGYPTIPEGIITNFKAWVTLPADVHHENDTATKTVKLLNNDPLILPYTENFETFTDREYFNELGMYGDFIKAGRYDFFTNNNNGRARTFVNTGIAHSGNRAITLDQQPNGSTTSVDSLILNINGMLFPNQTRLEFWYKNHGTDNLANNKVWIRANQSLPWTQVYDLYANQAGINQWKLAKLNINDVLAPLSPTSTFQIKFGQEGFTSTNSAVQEQDVDDGYTIDDISIVEAQNDLALQQIINPANGCGLTNSTPITVHIKNYNNTALTNIPVSYRINNGAVVTETITASIPANTTYQYTFSTTANFSSYTDYTLDAWAKYPLDTYAGNDTLQTVFHNSPVINTFPYLENFETNNGNYYTKSLSSVPSSWQYGTPAKTTINKAPSGTKAWVTNLLGNYNDNEFSYLYSPCFNLSTLTQPVLSFSHIYDVETDYDYTWVEYSTDGGTVWNRLGTNTTGVNWYDDATANRWRISNARWHVASIDIPTNASSVRFRFAMASDGGVAQEGVGIDDIHVFDKKEIYTGSNVIGISKNVSGNSWIHFESNNKRVASINANGQNLGATTTDVYTNTAAVRNSNNQYYADRNMVIRPTNQPSGFVTVRFYFTNAEVNNLLGASGCATCIKPNDAYELGVSKYSGTAQQENGTLADNDPGSYKFILPNNVAKVPYDNGYYAEYNIDNFSEFWLSKGDITPVPTINCAGTNTSFTAAVGSTYQWQENKGIGWVNISNGTNYAGATTQTLQLINIPASFNGYQYRCLVNTIPDAERVLYVGMTWTGAINTDWFNTSNWNCNSLPTQYSYVLIPSGLANYPVVNNNTIVKSIRVQTGATVVVSSGFALEVRGQ